LIFAVYSIKALFFEKRAEGNNLTTRTLFSSIRVAGAPGGRMGVHANPRADAYNSTRYLCVAAELDSNFAHAVIAEVLEEPFLAVAPSFGVDLVPVVCHALNARRRRNVRDVALTAIAAMNLLLNPFGMIATALTWLVTQVAYRRARLRWPQWGTGQAIAVAAIAGGAASVVFGIGLLLPQLILGAVSFAASGPAGGAGFALPLRLSVLFFPLSLLAVWGILRWERLATRSVLVDTLRAETFDPAARALRVEANPGEQERLWIVYQRQRPQNVTAYSGFFPFLGAGEHRDTWSVGIDLDRGAPAGPLENGLRDARKHPQPFSVSELQDHVTRRLEALRSPERPSTGRLEGLIVEDRLFVQGAEVWRDQRLLPDPASPPVSWVPQEVLEEIGNDPVGIVRHYKCARVESWGGEVVLSVFLHFAVEARTLYVEQTVCLLHPIDERYRVVDRMAPHMTPEEHRAVLWTTLTDIPAALLRAPRRMVARLALQAEGTSGGWAAPPAPAPGMADRLRRADERAAAWCRRPVPVLVPGARRTAEYRSQKANILTSNLFVGGDISNSQVAVGPGANANTGARGATSPSPDPNAPPTPAPSNG
jgi:hypothetical protein